VSPSTLQIWSPSGVVVDRAGLRRAARRLTQHGFDVTLDGDVLARDQRFAGTDSQRLAALHRVAEVAPSVALASRGGYGLTRLLAQIDWPLMQRSIERGTRWVGFSDVTALHLGLLAHTGLASWAGPTAMSCFSAEVPDDVTEACFLEAMSGELEAVGFRLSRDTPTLDGLERQGVLWGGNLSIVCALVGTPHLPQVEGGILFLEDVNEHPYRVERSLLQLQQAGVLERQAAIVLGDFSGWKPSPLDKGYQLKHAVAAIRARCDVPILSGLPFGHIPTHVSLPHGQAVTLAVEGREAYVVW